MSLSSEDCEACYLARKLNNAGTRRTFEKWVERAKPWQPLVDALRPHIERFDKIHCFARSDDEAIKAVTED